jgi:hypothetical protein
MLIKTIKDFSIFNSINILVFFLGFVLFSILVYFSINYKLSLVIIYINGFFLKYISYVFFFTKKKNYSTYNFFYYLIYVLIYFSCNLYILNFFVEKNFNVYLTQFSIISSFSVVSYLFVKKIFK